MPQIVALSCPVCAGPLKPDSDRCTYCGSYIVIKTDLPKLDRRTLNQSVIQEHIIDFRRRIRTDSFDEEAHYGLGVAYYNLGLVDDSIEELTQSARLMPENPHIQAQLAVALRDSFRAGNVAAESKMRTRIQNALLLDPNHVEANLLKADDLFDNTQYQAAMQVLEPILARDEQRAKPKLVAAVRDLFAERVAAKDWYGAQRCWRYLEPIDLNAARDLATRFLRLGPDYVPRKVSIRQPIGSNSETLESGTAKRILAALLGATGGLVLGIVLGAVIVGAAPRNGWASFLTLLLLVALPVVGAVLSYRHSGGVKLATGREYRMLQSNRNEVLAGMADYAVIKWLADDVVSKVVRQEESGRGSRKR